MVHSKPDYDLIARRIKARRIAKRMTQAMLAEDADLSTPSISYIETSKKKPKFESLYKIAYALGTTLDAIVCAAPPTRNAAECHVEILHILDDCDDREKQFIHDFIILLKTLRKGGRPQTVFHHEP